MVGSTAKLFSTLRALVAELVAPTAYHALRRYRVVSTGVDNRLTLQIVQRSAGFPDALPIALWPGVPGGKGEPAPGGLCLVGFADGDPALPVVLAFAPPNDGNFLPVNSSLDASGTVTLGASATEIAAGKALAPVVREGDIVSVGSAAGAITITTPLGAPPEKSRLKA